MYWKTIKVASVICVLLEVAMKEPRVTPQWILMPLEHKWSIKSSPQKSQDHASSVVDHTSRTDA